MNLRLRSSLNASTEHVLNTSLPSLIRNDGYRAPDRLYYHIPLEHISTDTRKKAQLIVQHAEKNIAQYWVVEEDGGGRYVYYVLSQSQKNYNRITLALIKRHALIQITYSMQPNWLSPPFLLSHCSLSSHLLDGSGTFRKVGSRVE